MVYQAGFEQTPGQSEGHETQEVQITFRAEPPLNWLDGGLLLSTATDAGNSGNTSHLRAGLLLGRVGSTNKYTTWAPTAVDGSEKIAAILARAKYVDENKLAGSFLKGGFVDPTKLIIPGEATAGLAGKDLEFIVRDQLGERFFLEDIPNSLVPRVTNVTADITIDRTWHGATITNIGASATVIVTLPTPKRGFRLRLRQLSNQILRIGTPLANQLKLSDGTTAQTLDLAAAANKVIDIYGIGSTYHAIMYGAAS